MIEVEMSRDVRDFEPKIIAFFTQRQLMCIGIGCAYAIPIALLLPTDDVFIKIIVALVLAAPAVICGWIKMFDMYFDKFFMDVLLPSFLNPQKRLYKSVNSYDEYLKKLDDKKKNEKKKKKIHYTREYRPMK